MKQFRLWFTVLALALVFPLALSAQNVARGSIGGTVYDTSGGVVPDAKVTLTSEYGTREFKAGPDGTFLFLSLEPGKYSLRIEYTNFKVAEIKGLTVRLNERTTIDVKLEPGAITQTVTVTEAVVGIDTSTTTSGGSVTSNMFLSTPVGRNISEIPYLVAGVNDGLGTGRANPSISGATGFENIYIVNGVNITNAGYGAFGTYSNVFGSLGSGVQFDFVKEVQVKTSGFEAQYGQALGGVINMITKSGGNAYHGGAYFYASPSQMEATRTQPNAVRFNTGTEQVGSRVFDVGGELGGYLQKDRFFWYGGFDAVFAADILHGPANFAASSLGNVDSNTRTYNYSGKVNYNLTANQNHQIEGSVFGDPSNAPFGPHRSPTIAGGGSLQTDFPQRRFSSIDYGSRNWSVRYTGTIRPTWLVNASFGWSHNTVTESNFQNIYGVEDRTEATPGTTNPVEGGPSRGINQIGGVGFFENTEGNNKQINFNGTNTFRFWGGHQVDYGYQFEDVDYDWFHRRSGTDWPLPCLRFDGSAVPGIQPADCGKMNFGATGRLRLGGTAGGLPVAFRFQQVRGAFTGQQGTTNTKYHAVYLQDAWSISKYITLKLGLRWEQQRITGGSILAECGSTSVPCHYAFTGNWAPRMGVIVDPWANRKTKFFFNFGRFFEKIPQDLAVRSLSEERSYISNFFAVTNPNSTNALFNNNMGHPTAGCPVGASLVSCLSNPANIILDQAHNITGTPIFSGGITAFAPGTRMQYQDEFVVGMEHEFRGGVIVSARYLDRRIRRIVEDTSGFTVGASIVGVAFDGSVINQAFVLGNPSKNADFFHNTLCHDPAESPFQENSDAIGCLASGYAPGTGDVGPDGLPDGFPDPIRKYQAFEFQVEKRFSKNWQLVGNWRLSRLFGNYEGLFRNDNQQTDANITSLFDFVASSSLGDQFTPGVLPTDRRNIVNVYASYLFNNGINIGTGWRMQSGYPLDKLGAHPAYLNQGEIPLGGRGSQGRSLTTSTIDFHGDYTWKMTERYRVKFVADLFNLFNTKRVARVDRYNDTGFLSGVTPNIQPNPDFLKPTAEYNAYQRPFNARLAIRLEF